MPTPDGRQLCIVYLSGVGDGLRWLLPMSDAFSERYSLAACISYRAPDHRTRLPPQFIKQCDLLICHAASGGWAGANDSDDYLSFLDSFSDRTRKIYVPQPRFRAFWPFSTDDQAVIPLRIYQPFWPNYPDDSGGSVPEWPAGVDGKPLSYPFGDKYLLDRLDAGMGPADAAADYLALDVASAVDLPELLARSLKDIEHAERYANVKVADFLARRFGQRKHFSTVSLPTNALFLYMTNQILRQLNLPAIPERILEQFQPLVKVAAPIHPSVGRHFGLSFICDTTRYMVDRHRRLTFAEYVRGYVRWIMRERGRPLEPVPRPQMERVANASFAS